MVKKFLFTLFILSGFTLLIYIGTAPDLPTLGGEPILYSNHCRQNLQLTLIDAIDTAKESIHLISFGLSDKAILKALKDKEDKNIFIYYDTRSSPNIKKILNKSNVFPITENGFLHQKILIIDKKMVFLGSANFTKSSLRMHDNLVVGFYHPRIAEFLTKKTPFSPSQLQTSIAGQKIDLWILPDSKNHAINHLKSIIRLSHKKITVAMFTLTHPQVVEELINAKKRGVKVQVMVDFHSGTGVSAQAVSKLKENKIPVLLSKGQKLMHHKFLYVDESILVLGSTNWTKAAFYKNRDCFVSLYQLSEKQKSFMNHLCSSLISECKK